MVELMFSQTVHFQAIRRQKFTRKKLLTESFPWQWLPNRGRNWVDGQKTNFWKSSQRSELNQTSASKNDPEQTYLIKHGWSVHKWKLSIYFWFLRKSFEFGIFWRISAVTSATDAIHSISSRNSHLNRSEFALQHIGLKLGIVEMRIFTIHVRPIFIVAPQKFREKLTVA